MDLLKLSQVACLFVALLATVNIVIKGIWRKDIEFVFIFLFSAGWTGFYYFGWGWY
jgi:hypothetical protein